MASAAGAGTRQRAVPKPMVGEATRQQFQKGTTGASASQPPHAGAAPTSMVKRGQGKDAHHAMGRVLIIYTGGTMGMKRQENGTLAPQRGVLTAKIESMHELNTDEMPDLDLVEYDPLLDSSNIGPVQQIADLY